ncbi:unnamed protein product [Symbiodinium sp. CCMP2592]|nr:unnamed protein product [Symbiodinium sp. CCMP2592]
MDEALGTRKNLDKLVLKTKKDKGDASNPRTAFVQTKIQETTSSIPSSVQQLRDISGMEDCIAKLGSLYDDLAGLQAEVPAKDIVARAVASRKDGDFLCNTAEKLSRVPKGHEEDGVFKSLNSTGMLVNIPYTYLDLGASLEQHPAFRPRDFLSTLCDLDKFSTVIGMPLESATVQLEDYWTHFCNQYREHPIVNDIKTGVVDPGHLVPLNVHGDGGRTYKRQELMVLQWQSAVGAGTSKSSKRRKLADEIDEWIRVPGPNVEIYSGWDER